MSAYCRGSQDPREASDDGVADRETDEPKWKENLKQQTGGG